MADVQQLYPGVMALNDTFMVAAGETPIELRQQIIAYASNVDGASLEAIPEGLRAYIDKVVHHAYRIMDADIEKLKEAGYSEDFIFEATVVAAYGASLRRFRAALGVLTQIDKEKA